MRNYYKNSTVNLHFSRSDGSLGDLSTVSGRQTESLLLFAEEASFTKLQYSSFYFLDSANFELQIQRSNHISVFGIFLNIPVLLNTYTLYSIFCTSKRLACIGGRMQ